MVLQCLPIWNCTTRGTTIHQGFHGLWIPLWYSLRIPPACIFNHCLLENASRDLPWSIKGFTVRETLSNLHFDFPTLTSVMLAHWKLHRGCYHDLSWSLLPVKVYVMFTLSSTQIPAYNFHFLIFFQFHLFQMCKY